MLWEEILNTDINAMLMFVKSNLQLNYNWPEPTGDALKYTGEPDSIILDRDDGHEVLAFIRKFVQIYSLEGFQYSEKIEALVREAPERCRTRVSVYLWVRGNWGE